jgi:hypothetical protein
MMRPSGPRRPPSPRVSLGDPGGRSHQSSRAWGVWILWVCANALAGTVGGASLDRFGAWGIVALALLQGTAQWLVLRRYRTIGPMWIPITGVSVLMGFGMGTVVGMIAGFVGYAVISVTHLDVLANHSPYPASFVLFLVDFFVVGAGVGGLTMGYVLGVIQRQVWEAHAPPPSSWLNASMLGMMVAIMATGIDLLGRELQGLYGAMYPEMLVSTYNLYPSGLASGLVFGLLYGAITGVALPGRQRQPTEDANRPS